MAGIIGGGGEAIQPQTPAAAAVAPQRKDDPSTLAAQRLRFYGAGDQATGTGNTKNTSASALVRFLGNAGGV